MPQFIKRAVPVEARQVPADGVDRLHVACWCDGYSTTRNGSAAIFIRSIGLPDRWCEVGDWIVKEGPGNFQQMSADDFAAEYEAGPEAKPVRTEQQIVDACDVLARDFFRMDGWTTESAEPLYKSKNPRAFNAWQKAVAAYEHIEGTDVTNAVANVESDAAENQPCR